MCFLNKANFSSNRTLFLVTGHLLRFKNSVNHFFPGVPSLKWVFVKLSLIIFWTAYQTAPHFSNTSLPTIRPRQNSTFSGPTVWLRWQSTWTLLQQQQKVIFLIVFWRLIVLIGIPHLHNFNILETMMSSSSFVKCDWGPHLRENSDTFPLKRSWMVEVYIYWMLFGGLTYYFGSLLTPSSKPLVVPLCSLLILKSV